MALKDTINRWLGKQTLPQPTQTTDTGYADKAYQTLNKISDLWKTFDDRKSVWVDIERMDGEDEIVSGSLDVIADRTTAFVEGDDKDGFYIETPSSEIRQVLTDFVTRTHADSKTWDIIRATAKHGSHFVELVVVPDDNLYRIEYLKQFPRQYELFRNEDSYGRLKSGDALEANRKQQVDFAAFDQIDDYKKFLAAFYPWQIVHFRYGRRQGMPYPVPYFYSARKNWKRLQILEDGMAMARLIRAYTKLAHEVLMPAGLDPKRQQEIVDAYKNKITRRPIVGWDSSANTVLDNVDSPYSVDTDFFVPAYYTEDSQGKLQKISPELRAIDVSNPQLQNLTDIRYSLNRLISRTKVPAKYLNFDIGQPRFSEQGMGPEEEQFGMVLKKVQMSFKDGMEQVCNLELLFHGISPTDAQYEIVMPKISIRNYSRMAQVEESYARAGSMWTAAMQNSGKAVPWEFVGKNYMRLRGEELQDFTAKLTDQAAETFDKFGDNGVGDHRIVPLEQLISASDDNGYHEIQSEMRGMMSQISEQMERFEAQLQEGQK